MEPQENIKNKSSEETQQEQNITTDSVQKKASDKEDLPKSSTNKSGTRGG